MEVLPDMVPPKDHLNPFFLDFSAVELLVNRPNDDGGCRATPSFSLVGNIYLI